MRRGVGGGERGRGSMGGGRGGGRRGGGGGGGEEGEGGVYCVCCKMSSTKVMESCGLNLHV